MPNPTLYDNFSRVKEWSLDKFATKEGLAYTLADVAFSGDYNDLENKPDLSSYATKSDLNSYVSKSELSEMSYATTTYVTEAIAAIPGVDLSSYVTKDYLSSQSYVTSTALESMAYATTTYVMDKVNAIIDGAPAALDTLNELAAAINDDANFASTVTTALGNKADADDVYSKSDIQAMSYITMDNVSACGYISSIPSEYVTDSELSACGYTSALTQSEMDTLFPISNNS